MRDYFKKTEWILDDVSFTYLLGRYRGRGLLTWDPEVGFHLETFVTRSGPPMPDQVHLFQVRLATKKDLTSVRMRIRYGGRAFAVLRLVDRMDVVVQGRLSCRVGAVRFMSRLPKGARTAKRWSGSALIDLGRSMLWPDRIIRTTQLEGETIGESHAATGLRHETPTLKVVGRETDGHHLEVQWSMDKSTYQRADAWRWPKALRDALSVELGCALPLLEHESLVSPSVHVERVRPLKPLPLDTFRPLEGELVDKSRLFDLTEFFMKNSREARICRKLFDQMVRASQQARWDDTELILSTALEGVLRALEGISSANRSWDLTASLARFRTKYFSLSWRHACKRALKAFEHLRHSTAHPDWIVDKMALAADAERSRSFNDLRFLSRFYGYMILALAGFKDLQPFFGGRLMTGDALPAPGTTAGSDGELM